MRDGWEYKKLGEVSIYPTKRLSLTNLSGQQYVGVETLIKDRGGVSFSDELPKVDNAIEFMKNDILIGNIRPYLKKIWKADRYGASSGDVITIRVADNFVSRLNSSYLYNVLSSDSFFEYDNINTHGAKMPRGDRKAIAEFIIPIPPLSIQLSIVSEIDMITEMISKYDEQLKELDKLSQSIFYEMFGDPIENEKGWEVKTLKNISEKITSGNNAKLATGTYKSEGIPYFRCQNVWKNRIDFKDMVYIDEETNQKLKSSVLKHNDLLITKIGRINTENSSLGRVSIYVGEDFKANLSGNLCFIRLLDTVNPIFVLNIMISNYFRDYIRRTTVGGTDKRALKSPQIGRFPIILPPLPLQQSFARKIEAIEAMKSKVREAKKEAETLLAARMQYWFE